ncbi:hypothetical protein [[Limnothrix rosea] IAM M-220]|uniref:hypothetical protein n=1 Tax=[Limnothrix rosea] IAM M-220 TaxID=454133 RepID=UPI0009632F57|nr:hypothetical protein [[Limnothrix rosea] IAM M-220]OKH19009.1 hypothetical protein NIES208_03300 [[Limnothrix rosea] IAM M-220]
MSNVTDTLIKAGLLNEVQVQVALHDQTLHPDMRISEILALRGWIAEETVDFFDLVWAMRIKQTERQPIGQYFIEARLITEAQVDDVLAEQKISNLRFGEVAILKGYLKEETVRFFVQHLFPENLKVKKVSPLSRITQSTHSQAQRRTITNEDTMQQTEGAVAETKQQYQQQRPRPFPPKPAKRKLATRNLLNRLKQQVQSKITEVNKSIQTPETPQKSSNRPAPRPKKPALPDNSFSTSFDLSDADDLDTDDLDLDNL